MNNMGLMQPMALGPPFMDPAAMTSMNGYHFFPGMNPMTGMNGMSPMGAPPLPGQELQGQGPFMPTSTSPMNGMPTSNGTNGMAPYPFQSPEAPAPGLSPEPVVSSQPNTNGQPNGKQAGAGRGRRGAGRAASSRGGRERRGGRGQQGSAN